MERQKALQLGLKKYNTGRLCKNGHDYDRYTATGACEGCIKSYQKKYASAVRTLKFTDQVSVTYSVDKADVAALTAFTQALSMQRQITRAEDIARAEDARIRDSGLATAQRRFDPKTFRGAL